MLTHAVEKVLQSKEVREVVSVPTYASVGDAVAQMKAHNVGAVVVRAPQGPIEGIFTERDLMMRVVAEGHDPRSTPVSQVMSANVRAITPSTSVQDAMRLMVEHRYRHLLIQAGDRTLGLISIRDLIYWLIMPEAPIAHEGRPGVVRARTEDTLRAVQELGHDGAVPR
jgi:signal-transduction protein with cAMP-binding, CBS, and nucleotidyltransferase domain